MAAEEKSQSEKFIEKAKELGADGSEEAFDEVLGRISRKPNVPSKSQQKRDKS